MNAPFHRTTKHQPLPLAAVWCVLLLLIHTALAGGRVAVLLNAVELGINKFGVGMLIACFALLPMFMAIKAGRRIDAHGSYRAMWLASLLAAIGGILPWIWPHWSTLAVAAASIGIGHMGFQIAVQGLLGQADAATRLRNYSWLAMALAVSGFSGPLIAGLSIDYIGARWAFLLLALCPGLAFLGVWRLRGALIASHTRQPKPERPNRLADIWRIRPLRYALLANLLLASAWDTHYFLVPLYGVQMDLSATIIGFILAAFSLATFCIRMLLPLIQGRVTPWTMIHFAMISAGAYFVVYPLVAQPALLMALSFGLGLSLGSTQPFILSLLQTHAPEGRKVEVFGMRMALVNGSQVSMPLGFGAIGTLVGIMPLFWVSSAALLMGVWLTRGGSHEPAVTDKDHPSETQS